MRINFCLILLQVSLIGYSFCWWDTGHMLVAKVAELSMIQEDSDIFDLSSRITNIMNVFSHNMITNFVESACWPDDVKKFGLKNLDEWHYIDLPVKYIEYVGVLQKSNITYKANDALGTLKQCNTTLHRWTKEEAEAIDTQFEKSMMARYLVHIVGDIHQPLHASSLFDGDKFKNGDQGGNLFKIKFQSGIENLHKLFDSGIGKLNNDMVRPLRREDQEYLEMTAKNLIAEFPAASLSELNSPDFADWIQESHDASQDFVYKFIQYDTTPTEEYAKKAFDMVRRRIVLGGYRLANLFKQIKITHDKVRYNSSPLKFLEG